MMLCIKIHFLVLLWVLCVKSNPITNAFRSWGGRVANVDWRRLKFWKREKMSLDPSFVDPVEGSSAYLAKLNGIIEELSAENEVLRTQSMIYKKNVQYHKDISARLRKEKEALKVVVDTVQKSTEEELTKRFNVEKAELMKSMQTEFDKKTKGIKAELKEAKHELKQMSKQLESAGSAEKQEIVVIKEELKAATKKLSASEALVESLRSSLDKKDKELAAVKTSTKNSADSMKTKTSEATDPKQSRSSERSGASSTGERAGGTGERAGGVRASGSGSKVGGQRGSGAPPRGSSSKGGGKAASLKKPTGAKSARK